MTDRPTIAVIGATGDTGQRVVASLCDLGYPVIATSRAADRLARVDRRAEAVVADLNEPVTFAALLARVDRIVNMAHAATIEQLLPLVPDSCERLIVLGSTRRDSTVPDWGGQAVRQGEAAFQASGKPGCMLHPTMIYGGDDEQNVQRIIHLVEAWPRWLPLVWPIPGGGKALVQPVHVADVAAAVVGAVTADALTERAIVVAGPYPMPMAQLLRDCATACGRRLFIVPLPVTLLIAVAHILAAVTRASPFSVAELQRSCENKDYNIAALRSQLGVEPRAFRDGLALAAHRHAPPPELG